ncbi:MAG: hypothetical protein IH946_07505 [Bacteroidetes bacterium]|nr:hypothetical protein [Bacteroidota bacterium]
MVIPKFHIIHLLLLLGIQATSFASNVDLFELDETKIEEQLKHINDLPATGQEFNGSSLFGPETERRSTGSDILSFTFGFCCGPYGIAAVFYASGKDTGKTSTAAIGNGVYIILMGLLYTGLAIILIYSTY